MACSNKKTGTYCDYIEYMRDNGYIVESVGMNEESPFVKVMKLKNGVYGTFLSIECPEKSIMTIPGLSCCNINYFTKCSKWYKNCPIRIINDYPYGLYVRYKNRNDMKMFTNDKIDIIKISESCENLLSVQHYSSLHTKFKFEFNVRLYGNEKLVFRTKPSMDIVKIEVYGKVDIFKQEN